MGGKAFGLRKGKIWLRIEAGDKNDIIKDRGEMWRTETKWEVVFLYLYQVQKQKKAFCPSEVMLWFQIWTIIFCSCYHLLSPISPSYCYHSYSHKETKLVNQ